jgi:hypothetical protein
MSDCDTLLASSSEPESSELLLGRLEGTMADLCALYPLWECINNNQLHQVDISSRMAKELGIANHRTATAYMLYHTVNICILQMKDMLAPSRTNMELRNEAAMKIATCLELKEHETRDGVTESNTVGFVATKVAWQALGGFNTPEGRRLAQVVRSAVSGVYKSPYNDPSAWSDTPQPNIPGTIFAQSIATATSVSHIAKPVGIRLYDVPQYETQSIDIAYKPTSSTRGVTLSLHRISHILPIDYCDSAI